MNLIIYMEQMWILALHGDIQGIWFWAGIYTLLVCSYSLVLQIRTRFWPYIYGELIELETRKFGATEWAKTNQNYTAQALYEYTIDGVSYTGSKISPWVIVASHNARAILEKQLAFIDRNEEGKVKVFYNPKKPKKSLLIIAGWFGIFITFTISTLPLALFFVKFGVN